MSLISNPILKRAVNKLTEHYSYLSLALLSMIITALTEVALPQALGYITDHGFKGLQAGAEVKAEYFPLWYVPAGLIGIFLVRGICTFCTSYLMSKVAVNILQGLRAQVFQRLLKVPIAYYHSETSGRIINSIMYEAQQISEMLKTSFTTLVRDSLTVLALMSYLIWMNWKLTLVTIVLIPGVTVLVRNVSKRLRKLNSQQLEVNAELTQVIEESTRGHQIIRIFGAENHEAQRFAEKDKKLGSYAMKTTVAVAFTTPLTQLLASVALSVVIVLALAQARADATTVGGFIKFITAMLMLLAPLKRLADLNGPLQRGLAACESVFALIDAAVERQGGRMLTQKVRGELEFRELSFHYPGQEQATLSQINLQIKAGETLALVGMSGGGKTSLVNLVPGFYQASQGQILLDGVDINELSLISLRAQIAMVSQHVVLFADSIAANVAYGDANPDLARVEAALQAAHLSEVIRELPEGVQTQIGENGMRLSGGQRQRLAIARAIYKDAPILILDEATSALDTESERAVQAALDELMKGRTTLVIAHRLSTIENADRIAVLVDGQISEIGTHMELLAKNAAYANLYRLQFSA